MQMSSRASRALASSLASLLRYGRQSRLLATSAAPSVLAVPNVWCVGRNYLEHCRELGNTAPSEEPMIFLKAGSDLQPEKAVVTLDLTARDIQAGLKQRQWPWSLAKTFPHSTPVGSVFGINGMDLQKLELLLQVNGKLRQQSSTEHMIFPIAELVQYIKDRFPVVPGDLILTGTPEGVSAIQHGDHVVAQVFSEGRKTLLSEGSWEVVQG